ncbi:uncharacterized protein CLUP02_14809 [Colletotrichum lupini]|uniref:Uncharacterized protein n=1 Tax=Colletotrichum lupini TaxID=145971 RepID=A0A9Q8T5A5_9PEZI|nr:uncharacterized protein CLUP02_14809 [Colletotrichum lupini]UQC89280.1 hypothetical protein CLUP02_14809 [Colletotrichum lupini]
MSDGSDRQSRLGWIAVDRFQPQASEKWHLLMLLSRRETLGWVRVWPIIPRRRNAVSRYCGDRERQEKNWLMLHCTSLLPTHLIRAGL